MSAHVPLPLALCELALLAQRHSRNWAHRNTKAIAGVAAFAFAHQCAFLD